MSSCFFHQVSIHSSYNFLTNQLIQIAAIEYMGNVISLLARDDIDACRVTEFEDCPLGLSQ